MIGHMVERLRVACLAAALCLGVGGALCACGTTSSGSTEASQAALSDDAQIEQAVDAKMEEVKASNWETLSAYGNDTIRSYFQQWADQGIDLDALAASYLSTVDYTASNIEVNGSTATAEMTFKAASVGAAFKEAQSYAQGEGLDELKETMESEGITDADELKSMYLEKFNSRLDSSLESADESSKASVTLQDVAFEKSEDGAWVMTDVSSQKVYTILLKGVVDTVSTTSSEDSSS